MLAIGFDVFVDAGSHRIRVTSFGQIDANLLTHQFETLDIGVADPQRRLIANLSADVLCLIPDGFCLFCGCDAVPPSVVAARFPMQPAVPFHAPKDTRQSGRLDPEIIGHFGLRKALVTRQTREHFPLPQRHTNLREFTFQGTAQRVRCREDGVSNTFFKVEFKQDISPQINEVLESYVDSTPRGKPELNSDPDSIDSRPNS